MKKITQRILIHIKKSKDLYELIFVVAALYISYLSVREARRASEISRESLSLGIESLAIQQQEFNLRNRPYIVILPAELAGAGVNTDGKQYEHTIAIGLSNISEIPANQIRGEYEHFLNGKKVCFTAAIAGALAKESPLSTAVFLEDDEYAMLLDSNNTFYIHACVTYQGMIAETQTIYSTTADLVYNHRAGKFGFRDIKYR